MNVWKSLAWLCLALAPPIYAVGHPTEEWDEYIFPAGNPICESHLQQVHGAAPEGEQALAREFEEYGQLVEQALVYRANTIAEGMRLKALSGPLSGADLQLLNEGMVLHLQLREQLLRMAESHECWLDPATASLERLLTPRQRLEGIMLSLSAALVLYDNYLLAITLFEEDARLRRVLNDSDSGYGIGREILTSISLSYNSIQNRARVRRAITFYEAEVRRFAAEVKSEPRLRYLEGLIEQSASYDMTKAFSPAYVVGRKLHFMERVTRDQLAEVATGGVSLFSMLFGNAVGLVETRHGKLFHRDDVTAAIAGQLRAGDILLEKTPFRLTDALIPGHWGHAAVWIGNEAELRALGLWDHPLVLPHRAAIRAGAGVVEALRSGVELNPLERFLNIDDIAVLRARESNVQGRATLVLNSLRQIGKDYDFNFDVETTDRIVCSELIYATYTDITWPTTKTLGRSTISPDQVAVKALPGGPLELVLLYHDGKAVVEQREIIHEQLLGPRETLAAAK
jgi:uncharacterized protein YycO